MLKSCPYCGRMHPVGYECQKKPRRKWYPKQRGRIERFRSTAAWQKKREEILMRDHYLCRVCLDVDHRINNRGLSVHHITPLGKDYDARLEEENLITLCSRHLTSRAWSLPSRKAAGACPNIPPASKSTRRGQTLDHTALPQFTPISISHVFFGMAWGAILKGGKTGTYTSL